MTYILTNFFSQNKTFYFFQAVNIFFFISAQQMFKCTLMKEQINLLKSNQHMSSHRNFGAKQIFWEDEFQADDYYPYALNNRWPRAILIWWALHNFVLWHRCRYTGERGAPHVPKTLSWKRNKSYIPPLFSHNPKYPLNCIENNCAVQSLVELVVLILTKWGLIKDQSMTMYKRSVKTFAPTLNKIFVFFNFY
jgi:hypothetical protein